MRVCVCKYIHTLHDYNNNNNSNNNNNYNSKSESNINDIANILESVYTHIERQKKMPLAFSE